MSYTQTLIQTSKSPTGPQGFTGPQGIQGNTGPTGTTHDATGTIVGYPFLTATPSGYLVCNGQEVSRTTYANLFAKVGTSFGNGNGTTTFNLPRITPDYKVVNPGYTLPVTMTGLFPQDAITLWNGDLFILMGYQGPAWDYSPSYVWRFSDTGITQIATGGTLNGARPMEFTGCPCIRQIGTNEVQVVYSKFPLNYGDADSFRDVYSVRITWSGGVITYGTPVLLYTGALQHGYQAAESCWIDDTTAVIVGGLGTSTWNGPLSNRVEIYKFNNDRTFNSRVVASNFPYHIRGWQRMEMLSDGRLLVAGLLNSDSIGWKISWMAVQYVSNKCFIGTVNGNKTDITWIESTALPLADGDDPASCWFEREGIVLRPFSEEWATSTFHDRLVIGQINGNSIHWTNIDNVFGYSVEECGITPVNGRLAVLGGDNAIAWEPIDTMRYLDVTKYIIKT